jgi:hypothetical protein
MKRSGRCNFARQKHASSMVAHDKIGAPAEKSFPRSEQNCQITQNEFLVFQAKQERSLPPCLSLFLSLALSLPAFRSTFSPIRLTSECFNLPFLYRSIGNSRDDGRTGLEIKV